VIDITERDDAFLYSPFFMWAGNINSKISGGGVPGEAVVKGVASGLQELPPG